MIFYEFFARENNERERGKTQRRKYLNSELNTNMLHVYEYFLHKNHAMWSEWGCSEDVRLILGVG